MQRLKLSLNKITGSGRISFEQRNASADRSDLAGQLFTFKNVLTKVKRQAETEPPPHCGFGHKVKSAY